MRLDHIWRESKRLAEIAGRFVQFAKLAQHVTEGVMKRAGGIDADRPGDQANGGLAPAAFVGSQPAKIERIRMIRRRLKYLPVNGLSLGQMSGLVVLQCPLQGFLERGTRWWNAFFVRDGSATVLELLAAAARARVISS